MKLHRVLPFGVIALAALSMGAGCPTVPKLEDRVVQLAVGGSTTLPEAALGGINTWNVVGAEDLAQDIDVSSLISKSGVDLSNVDSIKVSGISYRVTQPDPNPGRSITNGNVWASRPGFAGGAEQQLITDFDQNVDAVTDWTQAPVSSAGIDLLNGLLNDILVAAKSGTSVANSSITFHVQGTSQPTGQTTVFAWQLRINLTIIGKVKVKVIN